MVSITWTKANNYLGTYGVNYWIESSATLTGAWNPETLGVNVVISGNDVTYTFPPGGHRRYSRLRVLSP
jgi:hypothetical protein